MYVGPEGAGGTRVTTVVEFTPLRSASHLDSKISVGKSPKLGTRQGWFVGSHGMLREVEKTPLKLHWHASQLFLKYLTESFPLAMTIGQPQQQARISTLLLDYSRSREGFGTALQDPCQSVGLRFPGAHKESHAI